MASVHVGSDGTSTQVRLEDVTRNFGGVRALGPVTLEVEPGSVVAMVGSNGAKAPGVTAFLRQPH